MTHFVCNFAQRGPRMKPRAFSIDLEGTLIASDLLHDGPAVCAARDGVGLLSGAGGAVLRWLAG